MGLVCYIPRKKRNVATWRSWLTRQSAKLLCAGSIPAVASIMQKIGILTGGESTEREVALKSAANIQQELSTRFAVDVFDFPKDVETFLARRTSYLAAIPVFHGKGGEDGMVQGFLETLKVPYLFSGVEAHAV